MDAIAQIGILYTKMATNKNILGRNGLRRIILPSVMIMLMILMVNLASAQMETLGTFKQGECVKLLQTCSDCTYNVITSVLYPNSTQALSQVNMTKTSTEYNYTFCDTKTVGNYIVNGFGDESGTDTIWNYGFEITPSGIIESVAFWIFLFVIAYILMIIGLSYSNIGLSYFGGSIGLFLALYCLPNGIFLYKTTLTNIVSLLTLFLAIYCIMKSTFDLMEQ
jgi:hypothetical protein